MWTYRQSTGELRHNGELVSRGYSGKGRGKNNPALEGVPGIGPAPRGRYQVKAPYHSKNVGPFTLPLEPVDAIPNNDRDERTGRGAFRMHGDSIRAPGTASKGCLIFPRAVRERVWRSGDRELEVVA